MFGWFKGSKKSFPHPLEDWRMACAAALESDASGDPAELRRRLEMLSASVVDTEMELEMLDALERLQGLRQQMREGALPRIETQHRVVGTDLCHFTAPASLPHDPAQASGRLLLTASRAIFVGSGRTAATPWHLVRDVVRLERDVVLARGDRSAAAQFRFNTYGDAAECAFLARHLKPGGGRRL